MTALEIVQKFYPNVKHVKDATKDIVVEVTDSDSKSKAVRNHKECAFAHACKRERVAEATIISRKISYLINGDTATRFATPESLAREIVAFDRNAKFEPGIYNLRRPSPTEKLNSGRGYSQKTNSHSKSPKRFYHTTDNIRERISSTK